MCSIHNPCFVDLCFIITQLCFIIDNITRKILLLWDWKGQKLGKTHTHYVCSSLMIKITECFTNTRSNLVVTFAYYTATVMSYNKFGSHFQQCLFWIYFQVTFELFCLSLLPSLISPWLHMVLLCLPYMIVFNKWGLQLMKNMHQQVPNRKI